MMIRAVTGVLAILVFTGFTIVGCGSSSSPSDQIIEQLVSDHFKQNVLRSVLKNTTISILQIPRNGKILSLKVLKKEKVSNYEIGNTELVAYSCTIQISGTYEVMDARGQWATEKFEDKVLPVHAINGLEAADTWSLEWPLSALINQ